MPSRLAILATMTFLASSASAASPPATRVATEAVRNATADPLAVQFRNVRIKSALTCGEYNAKNAFGAYTGFSPFVFDPARSEGFMLGMMARISRTGVTESGDSIIAGFKKAGIAADPKESMRRMNKLTTDLRSMMAACE